MQMKPQHFSITILLLSIFGFSGCASLVAVSSKELNISSREEIKLGDKFSFHSHTLNETRSYLIHLPKSYNDDSIYPKKYPVLYILDGESHFNYASGMVDFMSSAGVTNNYQIPELIVVAIPNKEPGKDNRFRDYSPTLVRDYYNESGGGDLFLKFLRDELIPHIESEYRTIPLRVLAGHSMGGLLTIYDFLNEPSIFNAHIAMDPSIWWDNKLLFKRAREIDLSNLAGSLYLSTYGFAQRREEYREFIGIIDAKKSAKLRTRFQVFESERHGSLPIVSLYNGLLFIFEGYRPVELNSFVENPSLIGKHFSKFSNVGSRFLASGGFNPFDL